MPGKEIEKNLKKGLEVAALVVGLGNREVTPDALGGPFYYIEGGMGPKWKWLAKVFAIFGVGV